MPRKSVIIAPAPVTFWDQTDIMNRKQEYRARFYGYNLKIGLTGLIRAYEAGCRNFFEMAEFLDATEEYLKEAIQCYKSKYGICAVVDNYIIYFDHLRDEDDYC